MKLRKKKEEIIASAKYHFDLDFHFKSAYALRVFLLFPEVLFRFNKIMRNLVTLLTVSHQTVP